MYLIRLSDVHYYGGRTSNFTARLGAHLRDLRAGRHRNPYAQAVFNLNQRFEVEHLMVLQSEEDRVVIEQYWLDVHWGQPGCVNLSKRADGGMMTGRKHSEATKEKFRARRYSEETKKNWSASRKGRVVSEETRAKLSVANSGKQRPDNVERNRRPISDETRQRLREARSHQVVSEETCRKLSESSKRNGISSETRRKMAESRRRNNQARRDSAEREVLP